jgi:outer membrane protein insertion porin family
MFDFAGRPLKLFYFILFSAAFSIFFSSCSTVKNYQPRKPFVYQYKISINGKFTAVQKKQLSEQLVQQLDDSIRIEKQRKLLFWTTLKNPPKYDSLNSDKSVIGMHALLNSLGYYRDTISYDTSLKVVKDQYRTTVNFKVNPGIIIKLDSVTYKLANDSLQQITMQSLEQSLLKRGQPFAKPLISSEFDRLSDVYRNNGYLLFSKDDLLALWDTVGLNLLRPTFDPIEQAQLLEALRRRRLNPTADIEVVLRPTTDSNRLTKYYVGNVTVYPDYNIDTAFYKPKTEKVGEYTFIYNRYLFKPKKFTSFIYLHHGDLYRQSNDIKTHIKFNSPATWRLVNINQIPRAGQDTADIEIRLTPDKKYSLTAIFEGSKNQGGFLSQGNFLGLGATLRFLNRNFAKAANQATTNIRYGTELDVSTGSVFVQTNQFTVNHTIEFPRGVPKSLVPLAYRDNVKTYFSINGGVTDRLQFYNISSFSTSWSYEFNWSNKLFTIRVPNIEYNLLTRRENLDLLIDSNKSFKYIFNDGLILSTILNLKILNSKNKVTSLASFNLETSGLIAGLIPSRFLDSNLYRFIKLDAEYSRTYKIRRTAFAWRVFGGVGYEIYSVHNRNNLYLPFFREYYAGGPNSMRAWSLRKLGPGSTIKSFNNTIAPDRFGDMRLEANGEYRYYLTRFLGYNVEGALFTDIGNVWFLRPNPDFPGGEFNLNKLGTDIAIGAGTGLRIDFGFLKARFDYAYKVKDPSPDVIEAQNKWFYGWTLLNGQFQLGIDYPF